MGEHHSTTAMMFGLVLRHLRKQAGLTQRELGRRALYDHTRISRAENGEILTPEPMVATLDNVLGAGGLLFGLRRMAESENRVPIVARVPGFYDGEPVILDMMTADGRIVRVTISRRQFTQLLASGALSGAFPGLAEPEQAQRVTRALDRPSRVDGEVIDYFRRVLAEHYSADKMLGPRSLLRPVLAQIDVLDELRRGAGAKHADPLLQTLAQYAEMAGWLHQDLGELDAAMNWTRRAAEWALCAGDTQLSAYMLVRQSNIACLTDDYAAVVHLAAAARRRPAELEPKLDALAAQQQARGLVMLGESDECFALLDQAADTLRDHPHVTHPNVPVYLHHYDVDALREQSAVCHRAAGRADTAVSILEEQIEKLPANVTRDRGHLTAKLAVAVVQTAHPDVARAAHLGQYALGVARQTGSVRIHRELRTLDSELLRRWPDDAASRDFHEALVAV
ncbi:helix-turn-helix domain-containing protein [Streptosporangium saharense]|uniref:Transcriptional regulator with XRE-family HTH domain/tetratricopeptide (TPR) repeat protein n=1 Tax=Streptosporangium saharense TaxID=1706840 RepID=A0A7W7QVY5_9ACTN|nr:helix-turn-helix transcriptional regulator [Streptosporangium saharense]MBB4920569.1 transcriptional regulator with XRE-family HTH domain/tetratricopeptide (TPR) repeat protein [Streptosporangium saharense]